MSPSEKERFTQIYQAIAADTLGIKEDRIRVSIALAPEGGLSVILFLDGIPLSLEAAQKVDNDVREHLKVPRHAEEQGDPTRLLS